MLLTVSSISSSSSCPETCETVVASGVAVLVDPLAAGCADPAANTLVACEAVVVGVEVEGGAHSLTAALSAKGLALGFIL